MPFDLAYGRRIYGFWGRHPRLYWAGDWPIFFGRPGGDPPQGG
jgi:hypothetical protein